MTFEVTLRDRSVEQIDGADAYQQEGQMTTFFRSERQTIDAWSTRVASVRTAEVLFIRRLLEGEQHVPSGELGEPSALEAPISLRSA